MNQTWQELTTKLGKPVSMAASAALTLLAIFLLVLTVQTLANFDDSEYPYSNTITVEGRGKAASIPDLAVITFSVTETGATVSEAQEKATTKIDEALAAVVGLEVDDNDIKTLSYNVNPQYELLPSWERGPAKIVGYQVSQTVEVKIRDTAKAGEALESLGGIGVQNISGPNFTVDDSEGARGAARAEAIENAKAKAKTLASQLNVRLGKVVSFYENSPSYPMYDGYARGGIAEDMAYSVPALPAGEQETEVVVSITYEIR